MCKGVKHLQQPVTYSVLTLWLSVEINLTRLHPAPSLHVGSVPSRKFQPPRLLGGDELLDEDEVLRDFPVDAGR